MGQKFLSDPQKPPYGQKFLPRRVQNGQIFLVKFSSKFNKNQNTHKMCGAWVWKCSLGPNFTISKILGSAEISAALSSKLKFLGCRYFFFKNRKFSNYSNFKANLGIFSRPKYVLHTYPFFHLTKNFGSEISTGGRNFC